MLCCVPLSLMGAMRSVFDVTISPVLGGRPRPPSSCNVSGGLSWSLGSILRILRLQCFDALGHIAEIDICRVDLHEVVQRLSTPVRRFIRTRQFVMDRSSRL